MSEVLLTLNDLHDHSDNDNVYYSSLVNLRIAFEGKGPSSVSKS